MHNSYSIASIISVVTRDWGLGIGKPEAVILTFYKEGHPLEQPPLPTAPPPAGKVNLNAFLTTNN